MDERGPTTDGPADKLPPPFPGWPSPAYPAAPGGLGQGGTHSPLMVWPAGEPARFTVFSTLLSLQIKATVRCHFKPVSVAIIKKIKNEKWLWLVWLRGLSAGLRTKGSPVPFPVRAYAWVAGQIPQSGALERQLHIEKLNVELPLNPASPLPMSTPCSLQL